VIVECAALVHRRLGPAALRALLDGLVPAFSVLYVDEPLHLAATHAFVAAAERKISLVDWVSFQMMRDEGIDLAFAFDRDFKLQGFQTVP
jgi:predicted nucleic acid-binding protein